MGILWTVWPVDNQMSEWLNSQGVKAPEEASRFPTGMEIKAVLNALEGHRIDIQENDLGKIWQARIESSEQPEKSWTLLNVNEYTGDFNPQELWFEKGDENLIKLILEKLSFLCGPLVLIADATGIPEVIISKRKPNSKKKYPPSFDQLMNLKSVEGPKISPDGHMLAYIMTEPDWEKDAFIRQIWIANLVTHKRFQLTRKEKGAFNPKWSPDGKWLAFLSYDAPEKAAQSPDTGTIQIWLISPEGGESFPLTQSKTDIIDFQWSKEGSRIAYHAPSPLSKERRERDEKLGAFQIVDEDITMNALWVIAVRKKRVTPLLMEESQSVESYDWSPDGTLLAVELAADPRPSGEATRHIYLLNLSDRTLTPLSGGKGPETSPQWSCDGKKIAYMTTMGRKNHHYINRCIAIISLEERSPKTLTHRFDESAELVAFGPSGIFFLACRKMSIHLFRIDPENGKISQVTSPGQWIGRDFHFTSDFNTVTFISGSARHLPEIYISSIDHFRPQKITRINNQITRLSFGSRDIVRWFSEDKTESEGVLYKPFGFNSKNRYPLLVVLHGGPASTSYPLLDPMGDIYPVDLFLTKGAIIFSPNYRGSAGYGESFRSLNVKNFGFGDMSDVLSGVNHLIAQGFIDEKKMGVMGWSQGGYISAFLATHSERFKAASVGAGISNWTTYYTHTDIPDFTLQYLKATPWEDPDIYASTSPITAIKNAKTPVLIQHGEDDKRVPIACAYELYHGLKDHKVPTRMIVYKKTGHRVVRPTSLKAVMTHNIEWFNDWIWGQKE